MKYLKGKCSIKAFGLYFYLLHLPLRHTPVNTQQQEIAILGLISQPLHHQVLSLKQEKQGVNLHIHSCQKTEKPTDNSYFLPTLFRYGVLNLCETIQIRIVSKVLIFAFNYNAF